MGDLPITATRPTSYFKYHRFRSLFIKCLHLDSHPTMRSYSLNASLFLCAFATFACSGPIGPIAGGELEGIKKTWPEEWTFAEDQENVLLQTNPSDPYSVTVWGVSIADNFYVASSDRDAVWASNLARDPEVVLSIEGNLYAGSAQRVTNQNEVAQVLEKYSLKYDFYLDESGEANGIIYRLNPEPE